MVKSFKKNQSGSSSKILKKMSPKSKAGLNLLRTGKNRNRSKYAPRDVKHIIQYKNGSTAVVLKKNNRHLFLTGASNASLNKSRHKLKRKSLKRNSYRKSLSKIAALKAFKNFYDKKEYKNKSARKSAITRDLNHTVTSNRVVSDSRFKANPGKFDFRGVDTGAKKTSSKSRKKSSRRARSHRRTSNGRFGQKGGKRPVTLENAVKLLRRYYKQKYSN
jgi:hypothetical protein